MENIFLIGSEDVRRAGSTISSAADSMQSAASSIASSMEEQKRFLDEFICRFEEAVKQITTKGE